MYKTLCFAFGLLVSATFSFSAQDVASAAEGTVKKIDSGSKTIVVKTADGAEQAFHLADRTAVHDVKATDREAKDSFHGLKKGSEVAVHYTSKGTVKTAEEIDHIGKDGLKAREGTIKGIDRTAKTLTVTTASGTEETYRLTDRAAQDAGMDIEKGGKKSEKVTVYYTEEAGHKVAHFFKRII
jgi:hypothetical protein